MGHAQVLFVVSRVYIGMKKQRLARIVWDLDAQAVQFSASFLRLPKASLNRIQQS